MADELHGSQKLIKLDLMRFFEKTVFHYFRPQMIAHHLLIATTRMQITCYTTHVYLLHDLHCSLLPLITHFFVFHHFSAISPHRPIHVKSKSSPPLAKAYLPHEFQLFISSKQLLGEVWSDVASSRTPTNSTKRPSPPCPQQDNQQNQNNDTTNEEQLVQLSTCPPQEVGDEQKQHASKVTTPASPTTTTPTIPLHLLQTYLQDFATTPTNIRNYSIVILINRNDPTTTQTLPRGYLHKLLNNPNTAFPLFYWSLPHFTVEMLTESMTADINTNHWPLCAPWKPVPTIQPTPIQGIFHHFAVNLIKSTNFQQQHGVCSQSSLVFDTTRAVEQVEKCFKQQQQALFPIAINQNTLAKKIKKQQNKQQQSQQQIDSQHVQTNIDGTVEITALIEQLTPHLSIEQYVNPLVLKSVADIVAHLDHYIIPYYWVEDLSAELLVLTGQTRETTTTTTTPQNKNDNDQEQQKQQQTTPIKLFDYLLQTFAQYLIAFSAAGVDRDDEMGCCGNDGNANQQQQQHNHNSTTLFPLSEYHRTIKSVTLKSSSSTSDTTGLISHQASDMMSSATPKTTTPLQKLPQFSATTTLSGLDNIYEALLLACEEQSADGTTDNKMIDEEKEKEKNNNIDLSQYLLTIPLSLSHSTMHIIDQVSVIQNHQLLPNYHQLLNNTMATLANDNNNDDNNNEDNKGDNNISGQSNESNSNNVLTMTDMKRLYDQHHYLCNGLDLFLSHELCAMCGMAAVHSRFQNVFFLTPTIHGVLGSRYCLQHLPGINHRYNTFYITQQQKKKEKQ